MIKIIDGDLLTSNTDIIAHQVNCKGAFNSGVAKAIRDYDAQVYMQIYLHKNHMAMTENSIQILIL